MIRVTAQKIVLVASLLAGLVAPSHGTANTFRFASTTDPETLDPHAINSASVLGFLNNIYEGLVRRDRQMRIEGALAERWEPLDARGWRFHLRRNVTFHDGATFNADDVLFSYQRAISEESDVRAWFSPISDAVVVDDFTVDFLTKAPNPLFPDSIANFMILDQQWAQTHNSETPSREQENFATLNTNGTGAFMLKSRSPGVRTVLEPFPGWWGEVPHNLTEAVFTPITNQATSVAALLSGEIDFMQPIPLQDIDRVESSTGFKVQRGIEARVIMLGFGHSHASLLQDESAPNPFQNVAVRHAAYQAIDVAAITNKIMRNSAAPAALLVSEAMKGYNVALDKRPAFDPAAAREKLTAAGFPDGFAFSLKCPNDRYINDGSVCKAVTSMFARVGLEAKLETMPVRTYWPRLRESDFDMYLLGWSPGTFDAEHPLRFLLSTPNAEKKLGSWNFGGFSDPRIDTLLPQIQTELDPVKRQQMIDETHKILISEVAYIPLYVQPLVWGMKESVELTQRPDNFLILRWVQMSNG